MRHPVDLLLGLYYYHYHYHHTLLSFYPHFYSVAFYLNLSDSESSQGYHTNAVGWKVSILPMISNSSYPSPLRSNNDKHQFHPHVRQHFNTSARFKYKSIVLLSLIFTLFSTAKCTSRSSFISGWLTPGLVVGQSWMIHVFFKVSKKFLGHNF